MNIEKAVDRFRKMEGRVASLERAIKASKEIVFGPTDVLTVHIYVPGHGPAEVIVSKDCAVEMLRKALEDTKAEVERLQPIFNIANVALEGVLHGVSK